jgi:MFS family permease
MISLTRANLISNSVRKVCSAPAYRRIYATNTLPCDSFSDPCVLCAAGRRTLWLISVSGMLASYIIWTVLTAYFKRTLDQKAGNAGVACIFIYYFFYDIAWTPLLQAYPVEIYLYTLRGRGFRVTLASIYIGLIVGSFVNPIAMKQIGWKYYIVFCCILTLLLTVVSFVFPETKGHTLEEIAEIFDGDAHVESVK